MTSLNYFPIPKYIRIIWPNCPWSWLLKDSLLRQLWQPLDSRSRSHGPGYCNSTLLTCRLPWGKISLPLYATWSFPMLQNVPMHATINDFWLNLINQLNCFRLAAGDGAFFPIIAYRRRSGATIGPNCIKLLPWPWSEKPIFFLRDSTGKRWVLHGLKMGYGKWGHDLNYLKMGFLRVKYGFSY